MRLMLKTFVKQLIRFLPERSIKHLHSIRHSVRVKRAERAVATFRIPVSEPHHLPASLIVSLTSYPDRFETLQKTLRSLLMQTVRADRTILWVAHGDEETLPPQVLELKSHGLEIMCCDDIRSFKKIIPALKLFPESYIVTADDDLYYDPHWLETIVAGVVPGQPVVVCRRAHRPRPLGHGFAPYDSWDHDVITGGIIEDCIFPTTGAGALFPPGSLAPEAADRQCFEKLCPHADDVWLFVMALRAGARFRQVGKGFVQICWDGSQLSSLMATNLAGGNDRQLAAILNHFGDTLHHCHAE